MKNLKISLIAKKDGKLVGGWFDGEEFHQTHDAIYQKDIDGKNHISLKKYLKDTGRKESLMDEFLESHGFEKAYVLGKPLNIENRNEWKNWYWGEYNSLCKTCVHKCKQSHAVTMISGCINGKYKEKKSKK